jgi:hypothetical protein
MLNRLLGRVLRGRSATENKLIWNQKAVAFAPVNIDLRSPAFASMQQIPASHVGSAAGGNLSPALEWTGLPPGTKELALIIEDGDAALPFAFVHAIQDPTLYPATVRTATAFSYWHLIAPCISKVRRTERNCFGRWPARSLVEVDWTGFMSDLEVSSNNTVSVAMRQAVPAFRSVPLPTDVSRQEIL